MSSWTGFGSACTDPMPCVSPDRGQSPVGNVGGAGSREPLQGRDGVCRRVSRGSARSLAHGAVCVPQTGCGDVGDGAICSVVVHWWFLTGRRYEKSYKTACGSNGRRTSSVFGNHRYNPSNQTAAMTI